MTDGNDPYARIAPWYDRLVERTDGTARVTALEMSAPTQGMRVVDVGCGTGVTLEQYARAGCVCYGVDASDAMLVQARKRLGDTTELSLGSAERLAFDDNTFDRVLASLFLHELTVDAREAVLSELARVVTPTGLIVITDFGAADLTMRGRAIRSVSMVLERVAGRSHKQNCIAFLASGGIPAAAIHHGLTIETERNLGGGNMGVYVLRE